MFRGNFIGGLLAALLFVALAPMPVIAQTAPRINPVPRVTPPRVILAIRPSQAAQIAQRAFAGARVLSLKPRGKNYVVTLKVQNEVKQVTVDGETGDVQ